MTGTTPPLGPDEALALIRREREESVRRVQEERERFSDLRERLDREERWLVPLMLALTMFSASALGVALGVIAVYAVLRCAGHG